MAEYHEGPKMPPHLKMTTDELAVVRRSVPPYSQFADPLLARLTGVDVYTEECPCDLEKTSGP